jgi:hypothetical protein
MEVYAIEYAPDGERYSVFKKGKVGEMWDYFVMNRDVRESLYSVFKKGKVGEMWDYFVMNRDVRESLMLSPQSKFRLRNIDTDKIIGALKYDREKREFLHLRE